MSIDKESSSLLTGYWAMTGEQRSSHDAQLLDDRRLQMLTVEQRHAYVEALYKHTLLGCSITFDLLNHPDYIALQKHLYDVLNSFLDRKERLSHYLDET